MEEEGDGVDIEKENAVVCVSVCLCVVCMQTERDGCEVASVRVWWGGGVGVYVLQIRLAERKERGKRGEERTNTE